jgi:hypothetical protein
MSDSILKIALMLAYGPFVLMAVLYLVAVVMGAAGDRELLGLLVTRTSVPEPVKRDRHAEEHW